MAAESEKVVAKCRKCKAIIVGQLPNAWIQVTNSYYLHSEPDQVPKHDLKNKGQTTKSPHDSLSKCILQPLACSCNDTVAFHCTKVPDSTKEQLHNRDFYRLARIDLVSRWNGEMVEPVIKVRLPAVESSASISRSSLSSNPSPHTAHRHALPQVSSVDNLKADRVAVAGTNDGSLDWREAHENWTSSTGVTLSPTAFGERIMALGGGRRTKGTASTIKQPVACSTSPAPVAPMEQPNAFPQAGEKAGLGIELTRQDSAQSNGASPVPRPPSNHANPMSAPTNSGRPSPLARPLSHGPSKGGGRSSPLIYSTSFNPELTYHRPPSQSPFIIQQQAGVYGFGFQPQPPAEHHSMAQHQSPYPRMPSMAEYRQDMDALKAQFTHLQTTINQLSTKVNALTKEQSTANSHGEIEHSRDEGMDALAESVAEVSNKIGKVDSVAIQVETLKRKIKRLEDANVSVQATPSKERGPSMLAANDLPSTRTLDYTSNGFTPANGLKRGPSDDLEYVQRKTPGIGGSDFRFENVQAVSDSQPDTPTFGTEADVESQRPMMAIRGGQYPSISRKRGRPRKYDRTAPEAEQPETPQWERDSWMGKECDVDAYFQTPNSGSMRGGELQSSVVRRGTGGELIRTRRKPVRNADGLLLRADGTIDRRSFTSKVNLQKMLDARSSQCQGSKSSRGSPAQSQAKAKTDVSESTSPHAGGNPSKVQDHDKVMKQMFPNGVAAYTRQLNHAEQLLLNNSPEKPRMLPRNEMLREEPATEPDSNPRPVDDGPHQRRDSTTETSNELKTETQASESPKAPSVHSVMSELESSPNPPPPPVPQEIEDSESSFIPSTDAPTAATGSSGAADPATDDFVVPDSYGAKPPNIVPRCIPCRGTHRACEPDEDDIDGPCKRCLRFEYSCKLYGFMLRRVRKCANIRCRIDGSTRICKTTASTAEGVSSRRKSMSIPLKSSTAS